MEKVKSYREIARDIINKLGTEKHFATSVIRYQVIIDDHSGNYLLFRNGRKGETRIYGCIVHIEVTDDGKVLLHQDSTDFIVADMMLEKGIPKQDIVLGFHAPIMRADTEFSVG
ncbi:MAG: XisI protein [Phaeodactylibacter sp.]|nr:XisI protein [Phaeodactylibacter sp.]